MSAIRCPSCFRTTLTRSGAERVCSACSWRGTILDVQSAWDQRAEKEEQAQAHVPGTTENPGSEIEQPKLTFASKPNESQRERQLVNQAMDERLRKMGVKRPGIPDMARALNAEEVARRSSMSDVSDEQKARDEQYRILRERAGISSAGYRS